MNRHFETFKELINDYKDNDTFIYDIYNELLATFCDIDTDNDFKISFNDNIKSLEKIINLQCYFNVSRQLKNKDVNNLEETEKYLIKKQGTPEITKNVDVILDKCLYFFNNEIYIAKIIEVLTQLYFTETKKSFNLWAKYVYYLIKHKSKIEIKYYIDQYNNIFLNNATQFIALDIVFFEILKNNINIIYQKEQTIELLKSINENEGYKTYKAKLKFIIDWITMLYLNLTFIYSSNFDLDNIIRRTLTSINLKDNVTDKELAPIIDILKDSPIDELKTIENIEDILNKQGDTNGKECEKITTKKQKRKTRKEKNKEYAERIATHNNNLDVSRKWGLLCTDKINTNLMNLREQITNQVEQSPKTIEDLESKIINLENKKNKNKDDLDLLRDLKQERELKEEKKAITQKKLKELEEDKRELYSKLKNADYEESKNINKLIKDIDKKIKGIKEDEEPLILQGTLYDKYEIVKENKRTKEVYKLVVDVDYDMQNFNQEGRNFLYYVPNIPNVLDQLENDFITLDLEDYLAFFGRENGNISNIRKNLFNTLKEMRKESYEFTIKDDTHKGNFIKGSLVLIGDVILQVVNNKTTIAVQLGATFKQNIKNSILKGQLAYVNPDVWKSGKGQNKRENMAKELTFYFVKNARIEAKKLMKGEYFKDFYIKTIIDYLVELNLINYDTSRYNERVKEPLLSTLNLAEDMGFFKSETDAFKNYDDVINNTNNGKSNKTKIKNFENSKIRIILNNSTIDIEKMQKAHNTYDTHQKKNKKKTTN